MRFGASIAAIQAAFGSRAYMYLEFTDYSGAWKNYTALPYASRTLDFVTAASVRRDIDSNSWSATFTLARDIGPASISPLRTDSAINVSGGTYQPALDLHRRWRLWVAAPTPLNFRELARGWVDKITIQGDPAVITVEGRGEEADMIDRRILWVDRAADPLVLISETSPKVYAGGQMEDVLQAIIDEEYGAGVHTLTVDPSVTPFYVNGWNQTEEIGFFDQLSRIANLDANRVLFLYDDDDNLTLTLFKPNRSPTTVDWTTASRSYQRLDAALDIGPLRNFVPVTYVDENFGRQTVTSPVVPPLPPTSPSISRYGLRPLPINLAATTQVIDQTSAGGLADAIRSDMEFPIVEQDLTEFGLWFAELWDWVRTDANGVHYDTDQFGSVTSLAHDFQNGMLRTTLGLRGKPAGRYRTWLTFGQETPRTPYTPLITNLTASWKEQLTGDAYRTGVVALANVNEFARSVTFDLSDSLDFTTPISTASANVADGTAEESWFGSGFVTEGVTYYVRATPYSGPLSGFTPTGVAGEPVVATTSNLVKPEDTTTVTWTLDEAGKWKANVASVPIDTLPDEVTDAIAGGSSEIGTPVVFYLSPEKTSQWLALSTIPTAAAEIGDEYRRQEHAVGAGRIRLHAHVKAKTGTPTLKVRSSTDDFGTTPTDCVSLSVTATGPLKSDWATLDTASRADVQFSPYGADGADTAAVDLYALWMELLPDLVTAFRDFSDDFSDDFS